MKTHLLLFLSFSFVLLPLKTSFARDISFKWKANADQIDGYKLYYKTGSSGTPYNGKKIKEGRSPIKLGKKATGKTLHNLSDSETYHFVLTAYKGKEESNFTPELVLKGNSTPSTKTSDSNSPPIARISASASIGSAPLKVKFNGSLSTDSDGSIKSYKWSMGNGKNKSGKKVSYTYKKPGTYYVSLTVKDNNKATDTLTTPIIVTSTQIASKESQHNTSFDPAADKPQPVFTMELGRTAINRRWKHVSLQENFVDPVVVATPPSTNSYDPATIRIRNVSPSGFDIRIQEWEYQNGSHTDEFISYMAMERGSYKMDDGSRMEADTFEADYKFRNIKFIQKFKKKPVLITSVDSNNKQNAVSGQLKSITKKKFQYRLREQEANKQKHAKEQTAYIAWEPGSGTIGDVNFEIARTKNTITEKWSRVKFKSRSTKAPFFLASMQSLKDKDTSTIRYKSLSRRGVSVRIEEEYSKDKENKHKKETVGYMIFH